MIAQKVRNVHSFLAFCTKDGKKIYLYRYKMMDITKPRYVIARECGTQYIVGAIHEWPAGES